MAKSASKKTDEKTTAKTKKSVAEKSVSTKKTTVPKTQKSEKKSVEITEKKIKLKDIEPQILISSVEEEEKISKKAKTQKKVENVPVRYSDEDLEMFRSVIEMNRMEAVDELRMLKERLDDLNKNTSIEDNMAYSDHMAEHGAEALEKEKTYAQLQRVTEYIQKLNDALSRIDDKTYGICRVCNCLIAKERLLAVPITTLSASYKIHQRCPEDGIDRIEARKTDDFDI